MFAEPFVKHRPKASSVCEVRISSQSLYRVVEYDIECTGGNLSEAIGIEREVAFLAKEPDPPCQLQKASRVESLPCESSNDLESRTTEVHLRLRSLEAVKSCFPSSP